MILNCSNYANSVANTSAHGNFIREFPNNDNGIIVVAKSEYLQKSKFCLEDTASAVVKYDSTNFNDGEFAWLLLLLSFCKAHNSRGCALSP